MGKLCGFIPQIAVPVSVKIQDHPAGLQNAHPMSIGFFRVAQIPCDIPRYQHVKGCGLEAELLRIHLLETDLVRKHTCVALCLMQHGSGIIHRRDLIAQLRQNDGKKAWAGTDIQHLDLLRTPVGKACKYLAGDHTTPDRLLVGSQLLLIYRGIAGSPVRPVVDVFFLVGCKLSHCLFSLPAAL